MFIIIEAGANEYPNSIIESSWGVSRDQLILKQA